MLASTSMLLVQADALTARLTAAYPLPPNGITQYTHAPPRDAFKRAGMEKAGSRGPHQGHTATQPPATPSM